MWIRTHTMATMGGHFFQFRHQPAVYIKQLFRLVPLHPLLQQPDMIRFPGHVGKWNLMGAPVALSLETVNLLWSGPPFWRSKYDHWPLRTFDSLIGTGIMLDCPYLGDYDIQCCSHDLMHHRRISTLNKVGLISITDKEALQLFFAYA